MFGIIRLMSHDFEQYIPEIQALNLNVVTHAQKAHVAQVYGSDFLEEPNPQDYLQAKSYLTGPEKLEMDHEIRLAATLAFTNLLSYGLALGVKVVDPGPGFYKLKTGWRLTTDLTEIKDVVIIKKVRSLKNGTDDKQVSPFAQATFQNNNEHYLDGVRVPHMGWILRIGFDELIQFGQVGKEVSGVGNRAFAYKELLADHILYMLRYEPDLGFSKEVIGILEMHHELMYNKEPYAKPAIINPRSGLDPELATHMIRLLTGDRYLGHASLEIDKRIGKAGIKRRFGKLEKTMKALVKRTF